MQTDQLESTPAIAISLTGMAGALIIGLLTVLMFYSAALDFDRETSVPRWIVTLWEYAMWGVIPALMLCGLVWVMKRRWLGFALGGHLLIICGVSWAATVSYSGSLNTGSPQLNLLFYGTLALASWCAVSVLRQSRR